MTKNCLQDVKRLSITSGSSLLTVFVASYLLMNYVPTRFFSFSIHSFFLVLVSPYILFSMYRGLNSTFNVKKIFFFFLISLLCSFINNISHYDPIFLRAMLLNVICLFFILFAARDELNLLDNKLEIFLIFYLISSGLLVYLQIFSSDLFYISNFFSGTVKVKYGLGYASSPNLSGAIICWVTSIICAKYIVSKNNYLKYLVAIPFGIFALHFTLSDAALFSFFLVLLVLIFVAIKSAALRKKTLILTSLILLTMIAVKNTESDLDYYLKASSINTSTINTSTINTRVFAAKVAIDAILSHPLWGVGLGQFQYFYHEKNQDLSPESRNLLDSNTLMNPHNAYLQLLSELGLLTTLPFFLYLISILTKGLLANIESKYFQYSLGLLSVCIWMLAHDLFYERFFWIAFGLTLIFSKTIEKERK